MGKLSSIQNNVQKSVESTIRNAQKKSSSLTAKSLELVEKFHTVHDKNVAKLANTLIDFNNKAADMSARLISKIEKEETTTEKAKKAVNNAGKTAKKVASKTATAAKDTANKVAKKVEEATA